MNLKLSHSTTAMGVQPSVEKRDCRLADSRAECPAHEGVSLLRCPHSLRGDVSPCAQAYHIWLFLPLRFGSMEVVYSKNVGGEPG